MRCADSSSFFPLFDTYVYKLVNSIAAIRHTTLAVLQGFAEDGVRYLELRTTPRVVQEASISKSVYVSTVLDAIDEFSKSDNSTMTTNLILSIDRRQSLDEATTTVELARTLRDRGKRIVGIDLCGNPARGPIIHLEPAFKLAQQFGLGITLHFAEIAASASEEELTALLSWKPGRLGHVIQVSPKIQEQIVDAGMGVELCLSCNVLAQLTVGGYASHHFGTWRSSGCPVALSVSLADGESS